MVHRRVAASDPIRVAIVEDDTLLREGLQTMIDQADGFCCAGAFASAEHAFREMTGCQPDVLLLDIRLPGMAGSEAVVLFRQAHPSLAILMLTVYSDRPRVFTSLCNGANGYLLKSTPPDRLLEAIRSAHSGGSPISPEIAREIVELFQRTGPPLPPARPLSAQEVQLLTLLAEGHSYDASSRQMNVSINTVRNYIRSIYEKLHVHSKSAAVSKAMRQGLIG